MVNSTEVLPTPNTLLYEGYAVREGWWVGYRCHSMTIMNVKMGQTLHVGHSHMTKGELGVLYFISFHSYGQ